MPKDNTQSFAALLKSAVTEPGQLSQAYRQFHYYTVGNQLLAWAQCAERKLPPGPLATFPRWRELGRHVKRGEKALTLCMPLTRKRRAKREGEEDAVWTQFVYRSRWFVLGQTEGRALPEQPSPSGTARGPSLPSRLKKFRSTHWMATRWATPASARSPSTR